MSCKTAKADIEWLIDNYKDGLIYCMGAYYKLKLPFKIQAFPIEPHRMETLTLVKFKDGKD